MTDLRFVPPLTGLDQLRAMGSPELPMPPVAETLGLTNFRGHHGSFSVDLIAEERHYNTDGSVHGGVLGTWLDSATGCSVHSTLEPGESNTTLDLTVKLLGRTTAASGRLRASGQVIHCGRRTALAKAQVIDEEGNFIAQAISTCIIFTP